MFVFTKVTQTFPTARIPSESGGLPVEVSLIAQLGLGSGNHLFASVVESQKAHQEFVDELDEPSAKLGGTNFDKGDATSLYSFVVGPNGHPFHRHAGHRIFTAVAGSGGAQLRFSTASPEQIEKDPRSFIKALRHINIPPDCLFTVRFGGETWHQFAPLIDNSVHPAFFALSCHTNELGGNLPESLKEKVLANEATIPSLTELLPESVVELLKKEPIHSASIPTIALSMYVPQGSLQSRLCKTIRGNMGTVRGTLATWRGSTGYFADSSQKYNVIELKNIPEGSLLRNQFAHTTFHHEDLFCLTLEGTNFNDIGASALLYRLLEGFITNSPVGVSRMMAFRNVLVKPIGLRTSPLGCPVSSLLSSQNNSLLFGNRFPVLEQNTNTGNTRSQVILGADDKHLKFRSCVGVEIVDDHKVEFTLGTRVHYNNIFGKIYMALINRVHRSYITPTMLRMAVNHITQ